MHSGHGTERRDLPGKNASLPPYNSRGHASLPHPAAWMPFAFEIRDTQSTDPPANLFLSPPGTTSLPDTERDHSNGPYPSATQIRKSHSGQPLSSLRNEDRSDSLPLSLAVDTALRANSRSGSARLCRSAR